MKNLFYLLIFAFPFTPALAQDIRNNPGSNHGNRFEQLGSILPTPNEYRTASGAPGPKYWQQRCDYDITCELDEANHKLSGKETITYFKYSAIYGYSWMKTNTAKKIIQAIKTAVTCPKTLLKMIFPIIVPEIILAITLPKLVR